jgi:4-carboxymuconolactone decarboxylase
MPSTSNSLRFPPPTSTHSQDSSSLQAATESKSLSSKAGRILHNTYGPVFQFLDSTGNIQGPYAALLYTPDTFTPFLDHNSALVNSPLLTPRERELAILTACSRTRAEYLLYAHRRIAKDVGLSAPQVDDAADGSLPVGLSAREEMVCNLASELLDMWGKLSDEVWETGRKALGNATMSALIQVVGFYLQASLLVNAADVAVPQEKPEEEEARGRARESEGGNNPLRRSAAERSRSPNPASLRELEDAASHLLGRPVGLDRQPSKRRSRRTQDSGSSTSAESSETVEQLESSSRPPSLTHSTDSDTESVATPAPSNHQSMQDMPVTMAVTAEEAEHDIMALLQSQTTYIKKPQRQDSADSYYSITSEPLFRNSLHVDVQKALSPRSTILSPSPTAMGIESPILGTSASWRQPSEHVFSPLSASPDLPTSPWDFEYYPSSTITTTRLANPSTPPPLDESHIHPAFRTTSPFPPPSKALPPSPPRSSTNTLAVENDVNKLRSQSIQSRPRSRSPMPASLSMQRASTDTTENLAGKRWERWDLELSRGRSSTVDDNKEAGEGKSARDWI